MKYVELDSAEQLTFNTGVSVTKFGSVLTHSFVTSSLLKATMHFCQNVQTMSSKLGYRYPWS